MHEVVCRDTAVANRQPGSFVGVVRTVGFILGLSCGCLFGASASFMVFFLLSKGCSLPARDCRSCAAKGGIGSVRQAAHNAQPDETSLAYFKCSLLLSGCATELPPGHTASIPMFFDRCLAPRRARR